MQKISNYILRLSSIKLALCLIILPLIFALLHVILTILYRNFYGFSEINNGIIPILLALVFGILMISMAIWFLWLRATTLSVENSKLGLPLKWFHWAFGLFLFYLLFNLSYETLVTFMKNTADDFTWILYASRETINFIGLLILYPIICHYSARAVFINKEKKEATFLNSILYTLLLIFIPFCIPFLHNYISPKATAKKKLLFIYGIGLGIIFIIFMIALIASISGII